MFHRMHMGFGQEEGYGPGPHEHGFFHGQPLRGMLAIAVLGLIKDKPAHGAEIAQSLNLSEKTARNYVSAILEKLQLTNRIELATYAIKHHLSERMKRE